MVNCDRVDTLPPLDPDAGPPIVSNVAITNVTETTATLTGTVNANLAISSAHFEYGLTDAYGMFSPAVDVIVAAESEVQISVILTGLIPNTLYHVRLHASNGAGVSNSPDATFTSSSNAPTASAPGVVLNAAGAITNNSATLSGTVTPNGAQTEYFFRVSNTMGSAVWDHSFQDTDIGVGNDLVEYTGASWTQCTGCVPSTPDNSFYYGYTVGDSYTLRFNGTRLVLFAPAEPVGKAAVPVTVDGAPAGNISFNAATPANGIRFDTGLLAAGNHTVVVTIPAGVGTTVLFDHAEIYLGGAATFQVDLPDPRGIVTGGATPVSVNVTGLEANTFYTYFLSATNSVGTTTSATLNFNTLAAATTAPAVSTPVASSLTNNSVIISADVSPNGSPTTWQFEIGATTAYGGLWPFVQGNIPVGQPTTVTQTITGLTADTTYQLRIRATNAAGTTYSANMSFTTNSNDSIPGPDTSGWWPYGGSVNTNVQSGTVDWQNNMGMGRTIIPCLVYNNRSAGSGMFNLASGQTGAYSNKSYQLLLQTPPFPSGNYNYTRLINGEYNALWASYGAQAKARADQGFAPIIFSIGWEMNQNTWFYWGQGRSQGYTNAAQYVEGYRAVVRALRSTYPNVLTAWVINGWNTGNIGISNTDPLWPGDSWVTYRGGDWYNHYGGRTGYRTNTSVDSVRGQMARVRSGGPDALGRPKKLIVPEWGVSSDPTGGAGDNPDYINWMVDMFRDMYSTGHMGPETYFNEAPNSYWDIRYSKPNSRAAYQNRYRPR